MHADLNGLYPYALVVAHAMLCSPGALDTLLVTHDAEDWQRKGEMMTHALQMNDWFFSMTLDDDLMLSNFVYHKSVTSVFASLSVESLDERVVCIILLNNETIFIICAHADDKAVMFDTKEWLTSNTPEYDFHDRINLFFNNQIPLRVWTLKSLLSKRSHVNLSGLA